MIQANRYPFRMTVQRKARSKTLAAGADRYALYQRAVQCPDHDVKLIDRAFRQAYGRAPRLLREDFCGAAAVAVAWAGSNPERQAWAIDLDHEPLDWGMLHNLLPQPEVVRKRVQLIQADVQTAVTPKVDVIAAQNFSFCLFKERRQLLNYFRTTRRYLKREGLLVLDVLGGSDTRIEDREECRRIGGGVTYVWEQRRYDPISDRGLFSIHFRFKDGSELKDAFSYDWRLWSLPELRDLLHEAGFKRCEVYWEDQDGQTGGGTGVFRRRKTAPAEACWMAVLVGIM